MVNGFIRQIYNGFFGPRMGWDLEGGRVMIFEVLGLSKLSWCVAKKTKERKGWAYGVAVNKTFQLRSRGWGDGHLIFARTFLSVEQ